MESRTGSRKGLWNNNRCFRRFHKLRLLGFPGLFRFVANRIDKNLRVLPLDSKQVLVRIVRMDKLEVEIGLVNDLL